MVTGIKEPPISDGLVFRVCRGPTCGRQGERLGRALARYLEEHGHLAFATQQWQSCFGRCAKGPNLQVERWREGALGEEAKLRVMLGGSHPDCRLESGVTESALPGLVERHVKRYLASQ